MIFLIASIAMACEIKKWRQHQIICCQNGSPALGKGDQKIWIKDWPVICGMKPQAAQIQKMSIFCQVAIILGILSCIACHVYYAAANVLYQIFRRFLVMAKGQKRDCKLM